MTKEAQQQQVSVLEAGRAPAQQADPQELDSALPCPLCGYDLRGLPAGRCPECGHAFEPLELRRIQRIAGHRPIPLLVEYPPLQPLGSIRNALLTHLLTLRPRWFWRELRPAMPVHVGRLRFYSAWSAVMTVVGSILVLAIEPFSFYAQCFIAYVISGTFVSGAQFTALERVHSGWGFGWTAEERMAAAVVPLVIVLLWPWATLAILACFRVSLRQARVRPGHLLRCVTYSADFALVMIISILAASAVIAWWFLRQGQRVDLGNLLRSLALPEWPVFLIDTPSPLVLAVLAVLGWFTFHLCTAYRQYLAFPHALATVLSSQVILWLLVAIIWLYTLI